MLRLLFPILLLVSACGKTTESGADTKGGGGGNNPPVADAGVNVSGMTDSTVALNGTGSNDPDGDALTYHWSFVYVPEGSAVATRESPFTVNHSAEASSPSFTPDQAGPYIIELTVNDGKVSSAADQVVVTITASDVLPVANAGADQSASEGASITLNGGASYDPKGRPITYLWTLVDKPAGSAATLSAMDIASPTFTGDVRGTYVANLVVNNGVNNSNADAVTVSVTGDDHAPTSNAGPDQLSAEDCTTLTLDCSASADPDGDTLQYMWEVQSKPAGSAVGNLTFSDRTSAKPTFYPDIAGQYKLSCAVFDGTTWATPDEMTVQAAERAANSKPVVDAGAAQNFTGGSATCTEDGYSYNCKSCEDVATTLGLDATVTDPDGDPVTYLWELKTSTGKATIASPTSASTQVTLEDAEPIEPGACESVEYQFQVTVTDCTGASSSDTVSYTVECCGVEK